MFANDTSLFSVIHKGDTYANELNNDLYQINKWTFQRKMSFNLNPSKQDQEIIFSRITKKIFQPWLLYKNSIVLETQYQKYFGIFLDAGLTYEEYLKVITLKATKNVGLLQLWQNFYARPLLMTIYKFVTSLQQVVTSCYKFTTKHFIRNLNLFSIAPA